MPETKRKSPDFFKSLNSFAKQSHQTVWLATGFLDSGDRRRALMAMCLDGEFHKIATTIDEPLVAQIRLQWWRDEVSRIQKGAEAQQTDPALSLEGLLCDCNVDAQLVLDLIDSYDDMIAGDPCEYGSALFCLLTNDTSRDGGRYAAALGRFFQTANAGAPDMASLGELKQFLEEKNDERWPWLCLLEFVGDWRAKTASGPLSRRWRYWKAFLGGEKRLLQRLSRL